MYAHQSISSVHRLGSKLLTDPRTGTVIHVKKVKSMVDLRFHYDCNLILSFSFCESFHCRSFQPVNCIIVSKL